MVHIHREITVPHKEAGSAPSLVIMSSAYIDNEMRSEFGKLPPSFLPVGDGRLYEHQLKSRHLFSRCVITIPEDYSPDLFDLHLFDEMGVEKVFLPEKLGVGDAIRAALQQANIYGPVVILFGDTLATPPEIDVNENVVLIDDVTANYEWTYFNPDGSNGRGHFASVPPQVTARQVVCGYFHFTDANLLLKCPGSKLHEVLNEYKKHLDISVLKARDWHDFGHLSLYYKSRRDLLVARDFNSVRSDGLVFEKHSTQTEKMQAEIHWYSNLPSQLSLHVPKFLGTVNRNNQLGYQLEYLYLPTIADLFTMGNLPERVWERILAGITNLLHQFSNQRPARQMFAASEAYATWFFNTMIYEKTHERIHKFCSERKFKLGTNFKINGHCLQPLDSIINELLTSIRPSQSHDMVFWHGDLFFGNMLYDFRSDRVFCLDPRGACGRQFCLFGDMRYDISKLMHSLVGGYDSIIQGRYFLETKSDISWDLEVFRSEGATKLEKSFMKSIQEIKTIDQKEILAITSLLFLTMLPLHKDNPKRQDALLCRGLLIYLDWKNYR
jgi:fructosamine-3-kinase